MNILTTVLFIISLFYIFVIVDAIVSFIINKRFNKVLYVFTCYSFSILFTLRIFSLITMNPNQIGFFNMKIPVSDAIGNNSIYGFLSSITKTNRSEFAYWIFVCICLYLVTLFIIKMTTNINSYRIRSMVYCFLLLYFTLNSMKIYTQTNLYASLFIVSIILYVVSFFGRNSLKKIKTTLRENKESRGYNEKDLIEVRNRNKKHFDELRQSVLNGEKNDKKKEDGDEIYKS